MFFATFSKSVDWRLCGEKTINTFFLRFDKKHLTNQSARREGFAGGAETRGKLWIWRIDIYLDLLGFILISCRTQIPPYPSQATLEQKMQDQANWDSFRTQTINTLLDTLHLWHIISC